ncbi:MFS transporter [Methanoculleus bourgensis]|uniref:Major facilitator superfamily (MFS) profile domain-containing protein n=1 Tax=Methanoculleus bourgensis TaxID=83986 RepID=A0A0X3BIH4_9EURY|nr:MFS transporter [Methanoculleus bourgensis]CVK31394.1 membrane protein of unknown function [Methanoculleus bourgensis]
MEQGDGQSYSRKFILILITIATFLNPFTGTAINLALPVIGTEFSADATTLAWVSSAYLLSSVIFLLPAGKLGDSRGKVTVFMAGIVVYTAGTILTIFTPTIGTLLAFRFLQGIGGAMIYANSVALITHLYPAGERGYAIGLNITAVYAALSLGPFLGGILTQFFGWRSIFVVTALIAAPVLFSADKFPAFLNDRHREDFDIPGLVLSSALILCLFLGLAKATTPTGLALLAAALLLGVAFYRVERRHPSPLLPVSLLASNRVFASSNLAALINYSATYAVGFLLSLYLQYVRGYEPAAAGTLLLVQPVIQIFVAPVAGRLADRIRPGLIAAGGLALSAGRTRALGRLSLRPCRALGDDAGCGDHRDPGCPGRRGRALLVPEHHRRHGERGEALLRERIRDGCDDAVAWDDDEHGAGPRGLCGHHGVDRRHTGDIPGVPCEHEPDIPGICGSFGIRHLLIPQKE